MTTKADFPDDWAGTQINLGIAYIERIAGNRQDNLELAICSNTNALTVLTEKKSPYGWALAKNGLGQVLCRKNYWR